MPSLGIVPGAERTTNETFIRGSPGRWVYKRATNECEFPPLDMGVQAIQLSPSRAGVAGPQQTRLLLSPAFQPCACPLALSGPGQAVASESSTLNSGPLRGQFTPCVPRRTVSTSHGSSVIRPLLWAPVRACELHVGASPSRVIPPSLSGVLTASAARLVPITDVSPSPRQHSRERSSRRWLLGESHPMPSPVDTCSPARLRSAGLCPSCHRPDGRAVMNCPTCAGEHDTR